MRVIDFVCWVAVISLASAFLLSLADKWGIREWVQVHAPNDLINKLASCKFCCSWWTGLAVSLVCAIFVGEWTLLFVPFCSTLLTREIW